MCCVIIEVLGHSIEWLPKSMMLILSLNKLLINASNLWIYMMAYSRCNGLVYRCNVVMNMPIPFECDVCCCMKQFDI